MADEKDENDELLGMFVQEAGEHLDTIEPDLLTLEEKGSSTEPEIINRLFRGVHSIKGSAGFFGLTAITKLSHTMENLLGKVRENPQVASPEITDSLLAGLDKLKSMIDDVNSSESVNAADEIAHIQAILDTLDGGKGAAPKAAPPPVTAAPAPVAEEIPEESAPPPEEEAAPPAAEEGGHEEESAGQATEEEASVDLDLERFPEAVAHAITHGQRFFMVELTLSGSADEKQSYFRKTSALLESVGTLIGSAPDVGDGSQKAGFAAVSAIGLLFATVLEHDLLQTLTQIAGDSIREIQPPTHLVKTAAKKAVRAADPQVIPRVVAPVAVVEQAAFEMEETRPRLVKPPQLKARVDKILGVKKTSSDAAQTANPAAAAAQPSMEETLRVSVSLLDELINNAGELVLARNQLTRAAAEVTAKFPNMSPLIQNLDSITSRIQEKVMQARMQPVSVVFNKFPRIIRDLARKLEKKIDLELRGGDVDLDKSVIEHLSDPLTHMIRNVADHGIETTEVRLQRGKPEAGQVELAAYHENGMVNISLSDDGAGIDVNRIKMKALEKGIITEHQADVMSEEDAIMLIFAPGLSTAKKVSDVSGRGVGMDVVRTNIEKLGGTVHIESKLGKGTRIILKLPLTLAIIPAMIVSAGDQRFAIPEIGLVEIVRVAEGDRANQIEMVGSAPVLRLRNILLPLVNLTDVLGIQRTFPRGSDSPDRRDRLVDRRSQRRKAEAGSASPVRKNALKATERRDSTEDRRHPGGLVAYVMVLNVGGNEFGMVVDEVLDNEEIVVKPLPNFFKDNPCFSATTILGDGSVALIIDYAGVMEQASINFSNVERAARMDLDDERRAALREKQNIILLETGSGLFMGIVHSMVRRVEKIRPDLMVNIGGIPYVRYDRKTFRAIFPDRVLGLEGMGSGDGETDEEGFMCMVVPNIPDMQAGLIFSRIIDTRETIIDLDTRAIQSSGLFGSAQIDDRVVLFPDVHAVFEQAGIPHPHPPPKVDASGLRTLVVDDTPFLRVLTSTYLQSIGFEVDQAEDGAMALDFLKSHAYDLLVTDLNMPAMDGFELALEMSTTRNADVPMIATTSSLSTDLEQKCYRTGFVNCVPAIDKHKLLAAVAELQPE
ncbi:MAG: chemotaxis protein CheW [Magnetococcales bacterium]|nr:chemotaxis protein CheW [Magnetococcales bacterium]